MLNPNLSSTINGNVNVVQEEERSSKYFYSLLLELAQHYRDGFLDIKKDVKEAVLLYQFIVNQSQGKNYPESNGEAEAWLSFCYLMEWGGLKRNERKDIRAMSLAKKAIKKKHPLGYTNLGYGLIKGIGVKKNISLGISFLNQAIQLGNPYGYYFLANCMEAGLGVEMDVKLARRYYRIAACQNIVDAQITLGIFYYFGFQDKEGKVKTNFKKAYQFFQQAANQQSPRGKYYLAICYFWGHGVNKNRKEAFRLFHYAAKNGDKQAQSNIGESFEFGYAVKKNKKEAIYWYKLAAKQNDSNAIYRLGICNESGKGVKRNMKEALVQFELAASLGNSNAQNKMGTYFVHGVGVTQDLVKAFHYFKLASDQEHPQANYNLALCYKLSLGIYQDISKAKYFFKLAAEKGISEAAEQLHNLHCC